MPYQQLEQMLDAFHRTIGAPYSRWDPTDVLRVLAHCARTPRTWQKQTCDATGLGPSKVNRIIDVAVERGWISRPASRTPDARKTLVVTPKGRTVFAEFESLCHEAVGTKSRTPRAGGKKSRRSRIAEFKPRSDYLSEDLVPDEFKTLDK